jgi:ureidoacrylate peracid hydrolase
MLIKPSETALLIIDMQVDFCSPDGICGKNWGGLSQTTEIIARIKNFKERVEELGILTIFTRYKYHPQKTSPSFNALMDANGLIPICIEGSQGAELYKLTPTTNDFIIDKYSYDCYAQTQLLEILNSRGIKNVLISGVRTEICIDTSAKRTLAEGMLPIIIKELVATHDSKMEIHNSVLETFKMYHGLVMGSDEILDILNRDKS